MARKRVHTIQFDHHTVSVVETEGHRLFVNNCYVGECVANTVRISPQASAQARQAIATFAAMRGWPVA